MSECVLWDVYVLVGRVCQVFQLLFGQLDWHRRGRPPRSADGHVCVPVQQRCVQHLGVLQPYRAIPPAAQHVCRILMRSNFATLWFFHPEETFG